jgi:acyl-coenzyme A synthetase/AMP-(fatty) acid ligase
MAAIRPRVAGVHIQSLNHDIPPTSSHFQTASRRLRAPQLDRALAVTDSRVIVTDGASLVQIRDLGDDCERLRNVHWLVVSSGEFAKVEERALERLSRQARVTILPDDGEPAAPAPDRIGPGAPGCCLFTSGSTGVAKGVLVSEDDLIWRADAEVAWFGLRADDVLLSILPFSFDVGLNQLLAGLRAGATIVLFDSWLPADILDAVQTFGITGISGVPAIWRDFINGGLRFDSSGAHSTLRYLTVSGGSLSPRHLDALPGVAPGVGIFKTYGQTEAFRATSLRPEEFALRPGSVGRPFADVRIYVVDEQGRPCGPNQRGEVVHSGRGIMLGYLGGSGNDRKLRPNPFRGDNDPSELVVYTGDWGWLDEEGYLYLDGRRDAMLKVAGNRVYPDEVANEVLAIADVWEVEVLGVEAENGDTRLVAFVVVDPAHSGDAAELRRVLAKRLPGYMLPETVIVIPAIPRLSNGKPDRVSLRHMATVTSVGQFSNNERVTE